MKTFEEALRVLRPDQDTILYARNIQDIAQTILGCQEGKEFVDFVGAYPPKVIKRKLKLSKEDTFRLVALTAFASGILVGQEMEKRQP